MKTVQENQTPEQRAAAQQASTDGVIEEIQERMQGDESSGLDNLSPLGQQASSGVGDFVFDLDSGDGHVGTDAHRFTHVHGHWLATEHCLTYDQAREQLGKQQEMILDIRGPLTDWCPEVHVNPRTGREEAALVYKPSGVPYFPTDHALKNCAVVGNTSSFFVQSLTKDQCHRTKTDDDGEPEVLFSRDRLDAELLVITLNRTLFRADRVDQTRERLFRVWTDGTFRALLSDIYAVVNNQWVLNTFAELIPGGMCSHWRGDADSIYGNILIPDLLREERDSEYGGMVSIGNGEIGNRRLFSMPSVFRSICMNGCIWDQETGCAVNVVHKSRNGLDLDSLREQIRINLNKQIPLLNGLIDRMLDAQKLTAGDVSIKSILAECGKKYSWTRKQLCGVNEAWHTEQELIGRQTARTCFGVQAAITRFGQTLSNELWFKFDQIGGELIAMTPAQWDRLVKRADTLDEKALNKAYGEG